MIGPVYEQFRESLDVIRDAGTSFDLDEYHAGKQTPVFFGSALTNFGLEPFPAGARRLRTSPHARPADTGIVEPTDERFTGFVFKIQAEYGPRAIATAWRSCASARAVFLKDMTLTNSRLNKVLQASRAYRFFGRDRDDRGGVRRHIIGRQPRSVRDWRRCIPVHRCAFPDLPRFPAEHFGRYCA